MQRMEINVWNKSIIFIVLTGQLYFYRKTKREILTHLNLFILSIRCLRECEQYFNYFNKLVYYTISIIKYQKYYISVIH